MEKKIKKPGWWDEFKAFAIKGILGQKSSE